MACEETHERQTISLEGGDVDFIQHIHAGPDCYQERNDDCEDGSMLWDCQALSTIPPTASCVDIVMTGFKNAKKGDATRLAWKINDKLMTDQGLPIKAPRQKPKPAKHYDDVDAVILAVRIAMTRDPTLFKGVDPNADDETLVKALSQYFVDQATGPRSLADGSEGDGKAY